MNGVLRMMVTGGALVLLLTAGLLLSVAHAARPVQSGAASSLHQRPVLPGDELNADRQTGEFQSFQLAFSDTTTNSIANTLSGGVAECKNLPAEYRADCTAQTYRRCSTKAERRYYSKAKWEINDAARKLNSLVSRNEDKTVAPLKKGGRTYRAVKKSAVASVAKQAIKIITETETNLLRSAGSGERKVHYQRIARAVRSTKLIFRS